MARPKKPTTTPATKEQPKVFPMDVAPVEGAEIPEEMPTVFDPNTEPVEEGVPEVETKVALSPTVSPETANDDVKAAAAEKQPKPAAPAASTQSDTVTVCLNWYNSITYVLRINGSIVEVTFNGNNTNLKGLEKGINPTGGAYGMTFNVPRHIWEAVKDQHQQDAKIQNGLLFASTGSVGYTKAAIADRAELRTGNEPLDATKPIAGTTAQKD